jgi:hypothetical protein
MRRTVLTLIVVLAVTAPASAAFLGGNPRLGESFLNTSIKQVAGELSRELLPGWDGVWLRRAAECFVAPSASSELFSALRGRNLASLTKKEVGELGEQIAQKFLGKNGYTEIIAIQNRSGNGIDIVARAADGKLRFFEVKASAVGHVGDLSVRQGNLRTFVDQILRDAANGSGRYKNLDAATRAEAQRFYRELLRNPDLSGTVIGVDSVSEILRVSPW